MTQLGKDALPGFTAAKIKNVGTLRETWIAAQDTQSQSASAALASRAELLEMLTSVEERRRAIQLAADAEWPHTEEANAGVRKEFGLPPRRPLKV